MTWKDVLGKPLTVMLSSDLITPRGALLTDLLRPSFESCAFDLPLQAVGMLAGPSLFWGTERMFLSSFTFLLTVLTSGFMEREHPLRPRRLVWGWKPLGQPLWSPGGVLCMSSPESWLGDMEDVFPAELLVLLFRGALQIFQFDTLNKTVSYFRKSFCFKTFLTFKNSH